MCGIAGKYNLTDEPVSAELIERMCQAMIHRGPDDGGVHVDGSIGLGHRRLSILDLSPLGHQPMATPDEAVWITFNGEIYNFLELRKDLEQKGHHFKSTCDTEVILALYQEYAEDCILHLRGMFAFAIWDNRRKSLLLARDRIGKKPLYYAFDGKSLIFASELHCILLDPQVLPRINYLAVADYFKYLYVPDPKTIYQDIFKLEPGHLLVCSANGIRKKQYWDVSFSPVRQTSEAELAEELLALLTESVRIRQISDVPLGAFLSGGIDSSAVVALMAQQQSQPVTTCSIGFDSERFDEIKFARLIADRFHTDHHEFIVRQKAEEVLPTLVRHFGEPFADSSSVPTYYVSKLARQKVTVALAGDGGDENFAGYEKYHLDAIENRFRQAIPGFIRKSLFPFLSRILARGHNHLCRKGSTLLNTLSHEADYGFYLTNTEFADGLWSRMVTEEVKRETAGYDPSEITRYYYNKADTDDHFSRILYVDLKTYLPGDILVKVDRMSMANSLEVRAPLLDHKVIEFAARIPSALKYNKGGKKYILKESFKKILPPEIMYRKKMGFSVPLAEWLRGELKDFAARNLFANGQGLGQVFKMGEVKKIWDLHQAGAWNYATILWEMLMFELWHRSCQASK